MEPFYVVSYSENGRSISLMGTHAHILPHEWQYIKVGRFMHEERIKKEDAVVFKPKWVVISCLKHWSIVVALKIMWEGKWEARSWFYQNLAHSTWRHCWWGILSIQALTSECSTLFFIREKYLLIFLPLECMFESKSLQTIKCSQDY